MSKGSLFWANARGKLGEAVYYRSGGEQRTRTYVKNIKNPKSLNQMVNRISMANFSSIYRALKPIISVSFPNKMSSESGFNAFVKANKSKSSPVVSKVAAQQGLSAPVGMYISKGSLSSLGEVGLYPGGNDYIIVGFNVTSLLSSAQITDIFGTQTSVTIGSSSWDKVMTALGLPAESTKFTAVVGSYEDEGYSLRHATISKGSYNFGISGYQFDIQKLTSEGSTTIVLGLFIKSDAESLVSLLCSYRGTDGKLLVTNSRMLVPSDDNSFAEQFKPDGEVYQQVLDSYGFSNESAL